ncbi:MAG: hypothetical protein KJN90_08580 [Gammaproteobacteria bacterium]|nr:hypothetical protein [Gammaproteobacteria bacterium]
MKRQIRKAIDIALTAVGILIVLAGVFTFSGSYMQVHLLWTVVGLLLIEAGVWGIAVKCLPTERRFSRLREEGDRMISLIRELNSAALAQKQGLEDDSRFNSTLASMHEAVRAMADLASLEDGQAAAVQATEQSKPAPDTGQSEQTVIEVA